MREGRAPLMTTRVPRRCPCGSRLPYDECCGPLHAGRAAGTPTAETAEQLMRSRYSAFAVGDADYLLRTWHPSTRPRTLELDDGIEWLRLEVRDTTGGGPNDDRGTVEFVADYWAAADHHRGQQHERSTFVREGGAWYYVGAA
jgi:SEC-C motif-containing protein